MNKCVIYTCLTGGYDDLKQPLAINPDWDYICFSDCLPLGKNGVWDVRPIPYMNDDVSRKSRFVKILPHKVLSNYNWSIYLDANLQIVNNDFYNRFENLIKNNIKIAHVAHPLRDCIYDEIITCTLLAKDKLSTMIRQWQFLKSENYPEHLGLYENNMIFRMHNNPTVIKASEIWWKLFNNFSRRDQFSLCYVYWKLSLIPSLIFPKGQSTRNYYGLKFFRHESIKRPLLKRIKHRFEIYQNQIVVKLLKKYFFNPC